jgi:hypothetical protein
MMKSQRKKAASVGATGIILGEIKEPSAATKVVGAVLGVGAERKGKALAIYAPSDTAKVMKLASLGDDPTACDQNRRVIVTPRDRSPVRLPKSRPPRSRSCCWP